MLFISQQINSTRNQINTHEKKTAYYHSHEISVICLADTRICPNTMVVKLSYTNFAISTVFCIL
jgi:hypothetical protein